ncbi:MAG: ABC transporter permease subunit [Oligoflexia bacterium]|nr:ABC transporter permease subunit [Oligoflexia bacterium]
MISPISKTIFKRELKNYFASPMGYVFLVIFLVAIGHLTFTPGIGSFFLLRQATLAVLFQQLPWPLLFLIPAVSMRLWSEERKSGTVELLFTLPITVKEAVMGKFLAAWAFIALAIVGTAPMIFTVIYLGSPDIKTIFTGYLAAILLAGAFLSIGQFFSALTKSQVISFILSSVVCYLFVLAGSPPFIEFMRSFSPQYVLDLFQALNILAPYEVLSKGVVRLSDLFYFIILIGSFLMATIFLLNENKSR